MQLHLLWSNHPQRNGKRRTPLRDLANLQKTQSMLVLTA